MKGLSGMTGRVLDTAGCTRRGFLKALGMSTAAVAML
jgi:hypothetical protein